MFIIFLVWKSKLENDFISICSASVFVNSTKYLVVLLTFLYKKGNFRSKINCLLAIVSFYLVAYVLLEYFSIGKKSYLDVYQRKIQTRNYEINNDPDPKNKLWVFFKTLCSYNSMCLGVLLQYLQLLSNYLQTFLIRS